MYIATEGVMHYSYEFHVLAFWMILFFAWELTNTTCQTILYLLQLRLGSFKSIATILIFGL